VILSGKQANKNPWGGKACKFTILSICLERQGVGTARGDRGRQINDADGSALLRTQHTQPLFWNDSELGKRLVHGATVCCNVI
jgi:hypothetical protein